MFLIEYREGVFVNGEDIVWLNMNRGRIEFRLGCDPDSTYTVHNEGVFLNHLQALNENFNIESRYSEIVNKIKRG